MSDGADAAVLPAAAEEAWRDYCAMVASKQAHFGFLREVSEREAAGEPRSLAAAARLAGLLAEHDAAVKRFAAAMRALAGRDGDAHAALVRRLAAAAEAPATHA